MAATLDTIFKAIEALAKDQRALRKAVNTIKQHIEDPTGDKAKARSENNGFKKPQKVSPEMHAFLKLAPEEMISRADVTKKVNKYCEEHSLKKGQLITPDETLRALLNPPAETQITFLNIQTYINPHFIKEPKEEKPKPEKRKAAEPAAEPVADPEAPKTERPKVAKKPKPAVSA
jgi:upstream activation factor subunit UAF30